MYKLVLVRHGQSTWNLENRFTGWTDVGLSEKGIEEAKNAGRTLAREGYVFDIAFTSVLKRAIKTLWLVLDEMDLMWIPEELDWRLNERHYGALQGLNKAETAAKYGIMLDVHEPIHDTGERRTYPNMMTREGARGQEYNAWGGEGGNPPEHETILFFTRLLAGPMDFTPGIFDILIERGTGRPRRAEEPRIRTTLAKQLALYVVIYSPLQMAADLPENYERQPAFQFIRDVAVDWEQTRVLDARIGDHVVVARQQRKGHPISKGG